MLTLKHSLGQALDQSLYREHFAWALAQHTSITLILQARKRGLWRDAAQGPTADLQLGQNKQQVIIANAYMA